MNTVTKLLTDHMDVWTGADTEKKSGRGRSAAGSGSGYGIKKLRELILDLAVRGRLAPQDPNDEAAIELLKRIAFSSSKKLRGRKERLKAHNQKPFDIPQSWAWVKLGEIGQTQTGGTPSKSDPDNFGSDVPFINPADIHPNFVIYDNEGLSAKGATTLGRIAETGSILMVCIGTIGKCNIIEKDCAFNQQINSITPKINYGRYILTALRSSYFQSEAWSQSSSTTIAILNKGNWEEILVPIPPLAEQHRIVAKVDELMTLCDQLGARLSEANRVQQTLADALVTQAVA